MVKVDYSTRFDDKPATRRKLRSEVEEDQIAFFIAGDAENPSLWLGFYYWASAHFSKYMDPMYS